MDVYVDILIVMNYCINLLLLLCVGKLCGRNPRRLRLVLASLVGAAGSLVIFLPFMGFAVSIFNKLVISAVMVAIAFPLRGIRVFCKEWFVFFAVSFFFAGVILAIQMVWQPKGMLYYNGIVYFNLSFGVLIAATVAAYLLLSLFHRFSRAGRLWQPVCRLTIYFGGKTARIRALVDTGNRLYEPFSDTPVIVCDLRGISSLLSAQSCKAILKRDYSGCDFPFRLIPYRNVEGHGVIPAFQAQLVEIEHKGQRLAVERVYIGISTEKIGGDNYTAIMNPDLVAVKL